MSDLFSWDYLTSAPATADALNNLAIFYAILFAGGFLISSIVSYHPRTPFVAKYFRRRQVTRTANIAMWIFGLGLFFFIIRILQINPLTVGNRLWMILMAVLAIALGVWVVIALARAMRRGPLPKPKPTHSPSGYHASPNRRPAKRGHI